MLQLLFLAAMIISFVFAYRGLSGKGLQLDRTTRLEGRAARIVGACCLVLGLAMAGVVVWLTVVIARGR